MAIPALARTLMRAMAIIFIFSTPIQSWAQGNNDCFTLPNGMKFCPPQRVDELTQCAQSIARSPTLRPAEACRAGMVRSCRDISDQEFSRRYKAQRPKRLYPKTSETTAGWNRHCPVAAGYQYVDTSKRISKKPRTGTGTGKPNQNAQADVLRTTGANAWLLDSYDARNIPALKTQAPCLCRDGTEPLYGFCTGSNGTYKPVCK